MLDALRWAEALSGGAELAMKLAITIRSRFEGPSGIIGSAITNAAVPT
jgi:hypothetical protein